MLRSVNKFKHSKDNRNKSQCSRSVFNITVKLIWCWCHTRTRSMSDLHNVNVTL